MDSIRHSVLDRLPGRGGDSADDPDESGAADPDTESESVESADSADDGTNSESGGVVTVNGKGKDDSQEVPIPEGADVALSIPEGADIDTDNIEAGLTEAAAERAVMVHGQSNQGESTTVNPIADTETTRLGGFFSEIFTEFDRIDDDKINKLRDNKVEYNERVGKWILTEDDRIPAILNSQVGLILGQDGLEVEPEDPDNDADVRAAEHLRSVYEGTNDDLPHVDPGDVVREIMAQNYMAARSVLRSTDLADLPLETLTYYRDPEDSTEYYLQDRITYKKLVPDDEGQGWSTERRSSDEKLLELGEHVFDAHLFARKPLRSVADLVVNKMVLQRLMARKAEIASVGGLYIKVSPPDWLPESEYGDEVKDPKNEGETIKKLELHMREGVNEAFNTLQDYQSGFIMSIPSHWEVEQIEVPETGEPMADQIRAYNKSIAARLMFPIDLMELREGAELSRDTLFRTLLNVIAGWRQEILSVFDGFAEVQKDIYSLSGNVNHTLPKLEAEDEELILQALRNAGIAGLTTKEVRQALNRIEGFDLDEQPEGEPAQGPGPGGPMDPGEREQSMRDMLGDDEDDDPDDDSPVDENEQDGSPEAAARAAVNGSDSVAEVAAAIPDDFGVEVFRVTADPDDDTEYADSPLGVGVDFPSGGVYVDWNLEAFPDPLDDPHVSVYRTVDDFEKASGNVVEYVTDDAPQGAAQYTPPEGLDLYELEGWDRTSVWKAYISLGASHSSCSAEMSGELRNPDAWCAALKDSALGTDLWRTGGGGLPCGPVDDADVAAHHPFYAQAKQSYEYDGGLDDFATAVESVLESNLDRDVVELASDDDFVAFSPGGVDPSEDDDVDESDFDPIVVVKTGDGEYDVTGASDGDLSGLDRQQNVSAAHSGSDVAAEKAKDSLNMLFSRAWDPSNHPRGPDGKFIETSGISFSQVADYIRKIDNREIDFPSGVSLYDRRAKLSDWETGDIVTISEERRGEIDVAEVVSTEDGVEAKLESGETVSVDYDDGHFPDNKVNVLEVHKQVDLQGAIDSVLSDLSSEERVKAAQLVAQEASPSNAKLPQFNAVFDSLSQEELKEAFNQTATTNIDAGITRNLSISWFEDSVPGDRTEETPSALSVNSETLGYFTSRMNEDTLKQAVESAKSSTENERMVESIVTSAAHYGKSASARKDVINSHPDILSDDPVSELQTAETSDEFIDSFLEEWVKSEYGAVSQHLTLATTEIGPNTQESTSAYVTGRSLFGDSSKGIPLDAIEPTEEMRTSIDELKQRAEEYHSENGVPDTLYRGVESRVTTHGTVESWSKSERVAESFDGHSILSADIEPEDILISQDMLGTDWPQPENVKRSEEEYILFGGAFE